MTKTKWDGIQLIFGKAERGIWYDSDEKIYDPTGWGIKLMLSWGPMERPIPKLWRPYSQWNTWHDPWFTIRLPWIIGLFLSVAAGRYGFYIGFKENEKQGLIPSFSLRKTRWK